MVTMSRERGLYILRMFLLTADDPFVDLTSRKKFGSVVKQYAASVRPGVTDEEIDAVLSTRIGELILLISQDEDLKSTPHQSSGS